MPILLDTNVYLFALRSDEGVDFFERHFRAVTFRTYLSSVVVEELYPGALDTGAVRLVEHHVGALERAGRVVTPGFQDWKEAGKLVAQITRREPGRKAKVQQMLNDILLALSARRIGADLFTFNRDDFELIRRHKAFLSVGHDEYWTRRMYDHV
ncbi:MAG: type II toxin-antitoxin system VapC family toxin, partial [candidate division NC10 bacterium]